MLVFRSVTFRESLLRHSDIMSGQPTPPTYPAEK